MRLSSFKLASAVTASGVAAVALLFSAGPAAAENPPYSGCPGWALCLYKHGGGTGTKAIINPADGRVLLYSVHFLNGELANNQVTSWLNNSTCQVVFWDDPEAHSPWQMDLAYKNQYGATGDWSNTYDNDRLSGVTFECP